MNKKNPYIVIKLGGSFITEKTQFETIHHKNLASCGNFIMQPNFVGKPLILFHGAGSFAHIAALALKKDWNNLKKNDRLSRIKKVQKGVTKLNTLVKKSLEQHNLCIESIFPRDYADKVALVSAIKAAVENGNVPLIPGDIMTETDLMNIISCDYSLMDIDALWLKNQTTQYYFFSKPGGVWDESGNVIPKIEDTDDIVIGETAADITGGMRQKLATSFALASGGNKVYITHPENWNRGIYTKIIHKES